MNDTSQIILGRTLSRRALLTSTLAGAGVFGLSLLPAWPAAAASARAKKRSLILLWQDGGPSHFETFDPKPFAPSEYRGELDAISTALPGVAYCEVLPRLAKLADRTSVIRSLHQPSSDHVVGSHNVLTGWYGETEGSKSRYPDVASVVSRMRSGSEETDIKIGASTDPRLARGMRASGATAGGDPSALPRYIDISRGLHRGGPAFLGALDAAFQVAGDPSRPGFVVQNLQSIGSAIRFQDRQQMLTRLDRLGREAAGRLSKLDGLRAFEGFRQQAVELISGGAAARAFDLTREQQPVRERYGLHLAGQQCLLARRLVEAGVGVVAVRLSPDGRGDYDKTMIGWDDHAVHGNIFEIMRKRGVQFDQAVSALVEDLELRGMRDEVLVAVVGEFGRTPRVHVHKGCPGREHWGPAGCALMYGGGLTMGQIVGSTNDKGERPQDRPVSYQDLLATIYHALGIDTAHTFLNRAGRPVPILADGDPIAELTRGQSSRSSLPEPARIDVAATSQPPTAELPPGATAADLAARNDLAGLETLLVHDAAIDDAECAAFARCRRLKRLELNGTPISDRGLAHLASLTNLEELNLTGTRVTDAGLESLQRLDNLKRFSFNGTSVSLSGVVRLFVERQHRTLGDALVAMGLARLDEQGRVIAIDVAATSFGDAEMRHLGQLPRLRKLHLAATAVTDAGMQHVRDAAALEELYLARCAVSDAGLAHVAGLSRLRALNLYGTQITTAGLAHLAALAELRVLMITDLKLDAAAVEKLKQQCPGLTVTDFTAA